MNLARQAQLVRGVAAIARDKAATGTDHVRSQLEYCGGNGVVDMVEDTLRQHQVEFPPGHPALSSPIAPTRNLPLSP